MEILFIVLALVIVLVLFAITAYNKLIKKRNYAKTQWSQIEVQLKNRADLIPNVVNTVKGYAAHESETLENVIKARNSYVTADSIGGQMASDNQMTAALGKLFALSESYPDLKANQAFLDLQNQLKAIEGKINKSRQFYNDSVLTYNNVVETIPTNIIAGMFGFKLMEQFKATEAERVVPNVQF